MDVESPTTVRGLSFTAADLHQTGKRVPWRAVLTALGLLLVGSVMLGVGLEQYLENKQGHWMALLVIGSVAFIPGFYHSYIAFMAWRGYAGYSFSDLAQANAV